jgi:shikimate kinase
LKKSLVLTGMMGVGKSTIGKLLAKILNIKFIDTDNLITEREGKSIKSIFKINGEKYFRDVERRISLEMLKKGSCVIALGGGAFVDNQIRDQVLKTSVSFWLDYEVKNIIKRFSGQNRRPLLDVKDLEESMNKIYEQRKKIYKLSNYRIDCNKIDKNQITKKILEFYENN